MGFHRKFFKILAFFTLGLVVLVGIVGSEEGKRLMLVFTTDTMGELNPCG